MALVGQVSDPRAGTIPPGTDRRVARVIYFTRDGAAAGQSGTFQLMPCFLPDPGSGPAAIAITCDGLTRDLVVLSEVQVSLVRGDCRRRGLCNADDDYDISDPVALLSFLFSGGSAPACPAACDFSGDGSLDITDAVCLPSNLFLGGPSPTPPLASCEGS